MSFDKYNIRALSPSSINRWIENPANWIQHYCIQKFDDPNAKMWRGNAVEAGLARYFHGGRNIEDPANLDVCISTFEQFAQGVCDDETQKERDALKPMLAQACEATAKIQEVKNLNNKRVVEWWPEDLPIKVIGYPDFEVQEEGKNQLGFLDLKTTHRLSPTPANKRQAAFYALASNNYSGLLYVTTKKHEFVWLTQEEVDFYTAQIRRAVKSIAAAVISEASPEKLLSRYPINPDQFYWSKDGLNKALEVTA